MRLICLDINRIARGVNYFVTNVILGCAQRNGHGGADVYYFVTNVILGFAQRPPEIISEIILLQTLY